MRVGVEPVVKAFNSERQRHRREGLYEGGAAGGSVAAAIEARRRGKRAGELRSEAKGRSGEIQHHLDEAAKKTGRLGATDTNLHGGAAQAVANTATRHINQAGVKLTEAERLGRKAAWAARQSKLAAAGSAGLAAGAYGLRRLNN